MIKRCGWPGSDELMVAYHDTEWGTPVHDDRKLFEFLVLDAFQAGLSWSTILKKRENFRRAFDNFDYLKIAGYKQKKIAKLLDDAGIIRNKLKINATITNAIAFQAVQKEFGSFDKYIWDFVGGKPIVNKWKAIKPILKFVSSTICYAFMQAAGLVNDHVVNCFRYKELKKR